MTRYTSLRVRLYVSASLLFLFAVSCSKENKSSQIAPGNVNIAPATANPTKFGLYEADSSIYKLLYTYVSKIGTQDVTNNDYDLVFDTGSGGLVIDADGILPASMITASGFNFTGDSTVVNGITIYNQQQTIQYGDDANSTSTVSGYLAYAPVTLGDFNGTIAIKRLPFFLYYKAVDNNNKKYPPHEFDVLGVSPEYDVTFNNNAYITSPFNYFDPGNGLTKGFKIAALGTNNFSLDGTYVPGVITLGLTPGDLAPGGFTLYPISYVPAGGYPPIIPVSVTYNNRTIRTDMIFDTGTDPYNYIEDSAAADTSTLLPNNSPVSLAANGGYTYSYTTTDTDNLTYVENPKQSQTSLSVMGLEFFLTNEFLFDFTNHQFGLKNN
jgi:hypothetical protein